MKLGRWLGIAHNVVQYICYWTFPDSAVTTKQTTVQTLTDQYPITPDIERKIDDWYEVTNIKIGDDTLDGNSNPILKDINWKELEELSGGYDDVYT